MSKPTVKKRNWACVVYPDSLPDDWLSILQQTGLPCAISPLHDKDTNPDGTPKKAHYHVILCYGGPTSYSVVTALTDRLNAPRPQPLEQVRGYYRYLTHMDNPEKYQYDASGVACLNGFNISDYCDLTRSEVQALKMSLQDLIRQIDITEYADFTDYVRDNGTPEQYDVASNNTYFFDRYITSRRHKAACHHS